MILPRNDTDQFFQLMWGVQFYVKEQRQLLPNVKACEAYIRLTSQEKSAVRDALWEHPDLIDAYVQTNPDKRSEEELAIIGQWKKFIAGKFYVFRYLKDYAIFIENSKVYGVKGLYDPFDIVFRGRPLPILAEAVLLPYKGQIIYDGLCRTYNIYFGGGIRRDLKEEYMTAKQNGRILTSLEDKPKPAQSISKAKALSPETESYLKSIMQATNHLRGDTVVQKTALSVLRASAKVAETSLLKPKDIKELKRLERQISNALNRLEKVLERAEM